MEKTKKYVGNGRFELINNRLGVGAFGEIFLGHDCASKMKEVAIKLENKKCKFPQAVREGRIFKLLKQSQKSQGIPTPMWFGTEGEFNILVMDKLGKSLEALFTKCGRKFSLKTTLMLADQMLKKIEFIHSKSFIHRDIKPDNFLMGTKELDTENIVYIIDFGLSKKYRDRRGKHIVYRDDKHLTGTARYASINNHIGIEQTRRDDLEGLGYILVYFLKSKLPWQGLKARNKALKYQEICRRKTEISIEKLTLGLPNEFKVYLEYCRNLGFEEKPDYEFLRKMFTDLFIRMGFNMDFRYDWIELEEMSKIKKKKRNTFDIYEDYKLRYDINFK